METIWSLVPEATHFCPAFGSYPSAAYNLADGIWSKWTGFDWTVLRHEPVQSVKEMMITRPAEWDGQDRPPIGTVCEVYSDSPHADWKDHVGKVVFIVAHDAMRAVYRFETDSGLGYHALGGGADGKSYPFRPIRAPEQVAAENREQAARELFEAVNPEGQWHKFHADGKRRYLAAIDAGFGKQVKP